MRKILFFMFLLVTSYSYAQKIDTNKIDDFTGKQTLITTWEKLGPNITNVIIFRFRYENNQKYFELIYKNGINDILPAGMAIEFKTDKGIYELSNSQIASVHSSGHSEILKYTGNMDFFANCNVETMRIHFPAGYDDYHIKNKKRQSLISKSYQLFLENIGK